MSLPLVFRAAAQTEFDKATNWYDSQRAGLGHDFVSEVEQVLAAIAQQPQRFPVAEGDVRVTLVRKFPYAIYYRLKSTRIVVLALFHTSRDPSVWKNRI